MQRVSHAHRNSAGNPSIDSNLLLTIWIDSRTRTKGTREDANQTQPTVLKIARDDLLMGTIARPRHNLHVITDETGNVTFEDGGVAHQDTFVHHVGGVRLRDH